MLQYYRKQVIFTERVSNVIEIKEIFIPNEKSDICNDILRALPSWFGNNESIIDYTNKVQHMPFFAAYDKEKAVGFVAVKIHNEHTAEICVIGVLEEYHGQKIGKKLIKLCESYCLMNKKEFLTVKTLDVSANYEPYDNTRIFYLKMGFIPLEIFPMYWDKDNPCLFMAKYLPTLRSKTNASTSL